MAVIPIFPIAPTSAAARSLPAGVKALSPCSLALSACLTNINVVVVPDGDKTGSDDTEEMPAQLRTVMIAKQMATLKKTMLNLKIKPMAIPF
jgi:hypothetical protein